MATEDDRQEERDRMGNDPFDGASGELQEENTVERPSDRSDESEDDLEAEHQASTSTERPSNVTRSTEDLTIGENKKQPQGADQGEDTMNGRSSSEQAIENQERALESGEESPG